ncbi:DUF1501 domain-containing protein [Marinivivus vitaminiproducens]|uniref:DUF1501 domain-containing protein n=1 Tax=Marinivivus vitaminiproducens TaxID=3035935 RepID=UPI0027A93D93|nr:DUF1501 domain-containing protein [Geminicoccaceae bacterium SCSIO 64248]
MALRRDVLASSAAALGVAALPRTLFAALPTERRLVVVLLRGGLDGLAAIAPYGDPAYAQARGPLALPPPGAPDGLLDLDGYFGLHPALAPLLPIYSAGELLAVHACATPYRDRSHFSGQAVLESGMNEAGAAHDGWLGRALRSRGGSPLASVALAPTLPLILRGEAGASSVPQAAEALGSTDLLDAVAPLYTRDPMLRSAFEAGRQTLAMTMGDHGADGTDGMGDTRDPMRIEGFATSARNAGRLLARETGPRVAVLETFGWDTHAAQGAGDGKLARQLGALAHGLVALKSGLGPAWRTTVVVALTEFGRTVAMNGSGGTDHGAGGLALLLGGAVQGGRVLADWPGLAPADLHDGRELTPTVDVRSALKTVLHDHLGVENAILDEIVFPDSRVAPPLGRLVAV